MYIRDHVVAALRQDRLISRELDALWKGPLSTAFNGHVRRFQDCVKDEAGSFLYQSAGKWFEATDELWRCSEDFVAEMRDLWLVTLCRGLLRIRDYRHGGAVKICSRRPTGDLSIKFPIAYRNLSRSLAQLRAHLGPHEVEEEDEVDETVYEIEENVLRHARPKE